MKNNIRLVRLLLERGADVNARDDEGEIPSQRAKEHEVVELLFKYGTKSVE